MGCQVITSDATVEINAPLLRQVLAHIEAHPESWHQDHWRCSTGMCFAGWTAELSGGKWADGPSSFLSAYLIPEVGDDPDRVQVDGGLGFDVIAADDRARRLLGLDVDDAARLFEGGNRLGDIRRIVADLISRVHHVSIRIVPLDELIIGEAMSDGRAPLEIVEHRPGAEPMLHGTERGIPLGRLTDHARSVAETLGVPFIDPIDPAVTERLMTAEVAW